MVHTTDATAFYRRELAAIAAQFDDPSLPDTTALRARIISIISALERTSTMTTALPFNKTVHFRPPSKTICSLLPIGAPLVLDREPENPYDPNAIRVWIVDLATQYPDIAEMALEALREDGSEAEPDFSTPFHLGYLHREYAELLAPELDAGRVRMDSEGRAEASFTHTPEGYFAVTLTPLEDDQD